MGARGNSGVILSPDPARPGVDAARAADDVTGATVAGRAHGGVRRPPTPAVLKPIEGTILTVVRESGRRRRARRPPTARRCRGAPRPRATPGGRRWPRTPELLPGAEGRRRRRRRRRRLPAAARRRAARGRRRAAARAVDDDDRRGRRGARGGRAAGVGRRRRARRQRAALRGDVLRATSPTSTSRRSSRRGARSATRSSSSAATGSGTATSTPTTSARRSRRRSTSAGGRARSASPTCSRRSPPSTPSASRSSIAAMAGAASVAGRRAAGGHLRRRRRQQRRRASPSCSASSACRASSRGGQTLNPSTAELLAAVERANAEQVIVLPNNKNIIPVAEQVDALTAKTVRVVPTRSMPEGLAALDGLRPRGRRADATPRAMRQAAEAVATGEVTQAVRDASQRRPAPIADGDWIGHRPRRRHRRRRRVDAGRCRHGAARAPRRRRARARHGHHRRRRRRRRHRRRSCRGWPTSVPDVEVEVHDGGQPLYPYLVRRGVSAEPAMANALSLRELDGIDVGRLKGVGERKRDALRCGRHRVGARPAHHLPAALGRPHQRGPGRATSWPARRRWCWSTVRSAHKRIDCATGARWSRPSSATAPGACTSCSSTSRGASASCAPGLQVALFGKVDDVPRRAADDEPDRRPDRRSHRSHRADLPAEREGPAVARGSSPAGSRTRSSAAARAASPTRCPRRCAGGSGWSTAATALRGDPPAGDDRREGARPAGGWPSTSCCACSSCSCAQAGDRARARWASRHDVGGELVRRFHAALPYPLTGAQRRVIAEIDADLAGAAPDAPAAAGRRRLRQDGRRRHAPCSPPCRAGTRAR